MNFAAFLSYVILTSITPGPNNIMSMTNAGRYGFRRSLPFNFGVFAGFLVVMAGCALFSSLLYEAVPAIEPYMLCAGAAYILWLAFHVWRSDAGPSETGDASNSFAAGAALQFVNVKVILYGITSSSPSWASPALSAGPPSARYSKCSSANTESPSTPQWRSRSSGAQSQCCRGCGSRKSAPSTRRRPTRARIISFHVRFSHRS